VKRLSNTPASGLDYNLAQLLKNPTGAARDLAIDEDISGIDAAIDVAERLRAQARVVRTKNGALITFSGTTSVRQPCSRCLEPVVTPIAVSFEEEFLQTVDIVTGHPLGASKDDPALLIDDHHDVHLAGIVREYLLTQQPMHVLCRPDCRGLCPQCGRNLNQGTCGCGSEAGDERWAALQTLLKD
jgi:uncharacterized protein